MTALPKPRLVHDDLKRRAGIRLDAWEFLQLLDPHSRDFTFQTFDDTKGRSRHDLVLCRSGSLTELLVGASALFNQLVDLNDRGAGVFVTVNATDLQGRKAGNITRIRAVWHDHDDREGALPEFPLAPSIVVETSPGKFHSYWLVSDDMSRADHAALLRVLVERYGSDPQAATVERVLRVPGFQHRKGDPVTVQMIGGTHQRYTTAALLDAFKPAPASVAASVPTVATSSRDMPALDVLADALKFVSPVPRKKDAPDAPKGCLCAWLEAGMALHAYGEAGRELWDYWAAGCVVKYSDAAQQKEWISFHDDKDRAVSYRTITAEARRNGWTDLEFEFGDVPAAAASTKTPTAEKPASSSFLIRPYEWKDPALIDPREWLGPSRHFIRDFLSGTVSPGGIGKTNRSTLFAASSSRLAGVCCAASLTANRRSPS